MEKAVELKEESVAIIYEKCVIDNETFLMKPSMALSGKLDKSNNVFIAGGDKYTTFLDAGRLKCIDDDCKFFYGQTIDYTNLVKMFKCDEDDLEESIDEDLLDAYYDMHAADIRTVSIKTGSPVVKKMNFFENTEAKGNEDQDKYISVLYEKSVAGNDKNGTYMLKPVGILYGDINKDNALLIDENAANNVAYAFNAKNLGSSSESYHGNMVLISDVLDEITDDTKKKLSEGFLKFHKDLMVVVSSKGEQVLCNDIYVSSMSFDAATKKETEKDKIINKYLDKIDPLIEKEEEALTEEERNNVSKYLKSLNRFLYLDESISKVTKSEITVNTLKQVYMAARILQDLKQKLNIKSSKLETEKEIHEEKKNVIIKEQSKYPEYSYDDIYKGITKNVIAQDKHVALISAVLWKRMVEIKIDNKLPSQFGMMITGGTGTGKSEIFKSFSETVDFPIQIMDATQITAAGYVGRDIREYLAELAEKYDYDEEKIKNAVMVLDEVDKIKSEFMTVKDVGGKAVQDLFLKFMDGTTYNIPMGFSSMTISTAGMTPVSSGAFTDLYNRKQKNYGYNNQTIKVPIIGTKEFVEYGMGEEFMGRHYINVHLDDLNSKSLLRLLDESAKSPLKVQKAIFNALSVEAIFTEKYKERAVEEAIKRAKGARSLAGVVAETTIGPIPEISASPGKYNKVIFDVDVFENPKSFILRRD